MLGVSGKYRLDTRLGGGGMAEVFIGSTMGAEGFSRKVAIKRVLPGYSENPAFAQMFIDEAKISSRLVHPNIVSVLDFDRDAENRLFLVMELVEGRDLDALTSSGLLPIPVVIFAISEMLRGLGYAHDLPVGTNMRGVVHRDVSPHNVLLSWEGAVKVSDFGIAKARDASEATASVFIKGKPAYMSPEQANGQPLDGRSDLFAVGIMLWEMLIGRRLFVAEDTRATLAAVLFGQVPRPRTIRGDVPKDLERVVMKLLERDVAARYRTAEEAIAELLDCADAPRNGREVLTSILAERFPNEAPVRQSVLRARSLPGAQSSPPHHSMPAASPAPAAAHSLGAVMSAPTATFEMRPKTKGPLGKLLLVAVVTVLSGVVTFGVVWALKGKKTSDEPASQLAAGSPPPAAIDAGAPPPADAAPVDAAPADAAPVDAAPVDASVADAAPKDARAGQTAHAVVEKQLGVLQIHADPALTVTMDTRRLGDTPINTKVAVGKHILRMRNPDRGVDERVSITVTADKPTVIDRFK